LIKTQARSLRRSRKIDKGGGGDGVLRGRSTCWGLRRRSTCWRVRRRTGRTPGNEGEKSWCEKHNKLNCLEAGGRDGGCEEREGWWSESPGGWETRRGRLAPTNWSGAKSPPWGWRTGMSSSCWRRRRTVEWKTLYVRTLFVNCFLSSSLQTRRC